MSSSYFSKMIVEAAIQTNARYFEGGTYLVEIDHCKFFLNRKRQMRAAVECTVVDSNNSACPETTQLTWVVSLDNDSGPSTLKTFMVDLMGCRPNEITDEVVNSIFIEEGSDNATPSIASGLHAIVNAHEKPTQSGGKYTKLAWKRFDPKTNTRPNFKAMVDTSSATQSTSPTESNVEVSDGIPF